MSERARAIQERQLARRKLSADRVRKGVEKTIYNRIINIFPDLAEDVAEIYAAAAAAAALEKLAPLFFPILEQETPAEQPDSGTHA